MTQRKMKKEIEKNKQKHVLCIFTLMLRLQRFSAQLGALSVIFGA
jgi:hypothetical protein